MQMRKWKRDRAVRKAVRIGRRLRELKTFRAGMEPGYEHQLVDVEYLDSQIRTLEKKHADLISYLKSTA